MISVSNARTWADRTVGGLAVTDIVVAIALGGWAFVKVFAQGGWAPAFGVLAMTLPVAWRRPMPLTAAATLAVATPSTGCCSGR